MKSAIMLPAVIMLSCLMFNSCGSSKHDASREEQIHAAKEKMNELKNPPPSPAPNTCQIIAVVEAIDKTLRGSSEKDPCGRAPCMATIMIDSVLAYGPAFPKVLNVGDRIQVTFAHTLNPTKDVWPEIQPPLPGLRMGSRFAATLRGSATMGSNSPSFTVYRYERK